MVGCRHHHGGRTTCPHREGQSESFGGSNKPMALLEVRTFHGNGSMLRLPSGKATGSLLRGLGVYTSIWESFASAEMRIIIVRKAVRGRQGPRPCRRQRNGPRDTILPGHPCLSAVIVCCRLASIDALWVLFAIVPPSPACIGRATWLPWALVGN